MTFRAALGGLVTGGLGLLAGLAGLAFDVPLFGAVAGVLALAAGFAGMRLAQRLEEQAAIQELVEAELRAMRSAPPAPASTPESTPDAAAVDDDALLLDDDRPADDDEAGDPAAALIDENTGLFSESFFVVALDSRIAAARRHLRPVAMVLLDVVEGLPDDPTPADATLVAETVKRTLRDSDTASRLRNGYFALLLEDTPENGAIWTVERIRRRLAEESDELTTWAGVACYPAHAFSPEEMIEAAEQALVVAREWRQDRIEVATAAD